jgi:import receptor subunit TOM20
MNVAVDTIDVPDGSGNLMRKKVLVVTKDFDAGELIYKVCHLTYILLVY